MNSPMNLSEKVARSTTEPGVYMMKDTQGVIIYIGKAKNLKKRLSSYFIRKNHLDVKTGVLVSKIADFDTLVTKTEQEALILEANLIRRHKPKYNVILKDDKRYPLLKVHIHDPYPFIEKVRKMSDDGNRYFGPFAASSSLNHSLKIIHRTFKLRNCGNKTFHRRTRPCLNYQMGHCLGPCCLDVSRADYGEIVKEVILFLKGRMPELAVKIRKDMLDAADAQDFEAAAAFRDKLFAIEKIMEKQTVVSTDMADRDVIALAQGQALVVITVLSIRNGYWIGTRHFALHDMIIDPSDIAGAFIKQYYTKVSFIPPEIIVDQSIDDLGSLEEWLRQIKGKKVSILFPKRGEKVRLMDMALKNAEKELNDRLEAGAAARNLIDRLQQKLQMNTLPSTIECFDNSNLQGENPVAGMVVFQDGEPMKSLYRKFKIRSVEIQDDYAYMREVLSRRYGKQDKDMALPDLLMVDGGRGQLNIALAVLDELNLSHAFTVIGIAKKDEGKGETGDKIFLPNRSNPVIFGKDNDLLLFLQRIRDEAHRFAITFHRHVRSRSLLHSALDDIPGIGKKRKALLLKTFGGQAQLKTATLEEIAALPGLNMELAHRIKKYMEGV